MRKQEGKDCRDVDAGIVKDLGRENEVYFERFYFFSEGRNKGLEKEY